MKRRTKTYKTSKTHGINVNIKLYMDPSSVKQGPFPCFPLKMKSFFLWREKKQKYVKRLNAK